MNPHCSPEELREWITQHLDPLDAQPAHPASVRSDYDLNPQDAPAQPSPLTPAAVLMGLVARPAGLSVILTRRSDTLRKHTGQVAFPGGRADPGETPWQTALREAHEEIGLHPERVAVAGLSTPYQTGTGYLVTPVVGFVEPPFDLTPNPDEVAVIFETPFGFLMDPSNYEEKQGRTPAGDQRRFYATTWEDQYIWGATAGMLRALYERLYGAAMG
ncbi:CoA pyrophosphatase [Caulobacter sp. KR2-114]|uniref:CoA pyrophosphatase n=1 Tax=Caulobacter sp. KR2-114 TaxID=3400912 RepID=UPI003C00CD92